MAFHLPSRRPLIAVFGILVSVCALHAQWDPRLQHSPTDFLDLYQQSTSTTIVPEILTVFDFSGSMASLMFHPMYVNNDLTDSDDYQYVSFTMQALPTSYTVTATSQGTSRDTTSYTFTVGGSGSGSLTNGSSHYTLTKMTASPTTFTAGTTITFSTTLTSSNNQSYSNTGISWTVTDSNGNTDATGTTNSTFGTASTFSFTLLSSTVTASLRVDPLASSGYTMNTTLSGGLLVKPNGTLVASSDAAAASTTSGLYGASKGSSDIRNWIRAASHVRWSYNDGGTVRTIDVPLPWKVTSGGSSGNPLSSLTQYDSGTQTNVEFDLTYKINSGDDTLTNSNGGGLGSGTATSATLNTVAYRPTYIAWLFQGKYANGPYTGDYVAYDSGSAIAGGQTSVAWGQGYGTFGASDTITIPVYNADGTYSGSNTTVAAGNEIAPARTRCQAVKQAAITTWINYQTQVVWAYRFLDVNHESGVPSSSTTFNDASASYTAGDPTAGEVYGSASGWQVMNGNSATEMARIASYFPANGTPLTYAMARGLAQFLDPSSVFNGIENGVTAPLPVQCLNHFLILFTDGIDNNNTNNSNPNAGTPYIDTTGGNTGSAVNGNTGIIAHPTYLNGGQWWNLFTFAGVSAHLSDSSLGTGNYKIPPNSYSSPATPSGYLPYAITARNGVTFSPAHRVQTMTVGVSLGGQYTNTSSPKRALFVAAAIGDPHVTSWNLANCTPFTLKVPTDPTQGGSANSIYFFDGSNPDALLSSLDSAFRAAIAMSNVNATTSPNLPFIGGTLANEAYLGTFQPPSTGGVLWSGDLLMFPIRTVNGQVEFVDNNGNPLTTLTASTAGWAASLALNPNTNGRLWSARNLYTRIPGGTSLTPFTDVNSSTTSPANAFNIIAPYLLTDTTNPTTAEKTLAVQWAAGGNTGGALDVNGRPTTNRDNIMGDIIDSVPATIEYTLTPTIQSGLSGKLSAALSATATNHFRLILVGDNQGWLHAFGEISYTSPVLSGGQPVKDSQGNVIYVVTAAVDELWAFMPTDFLGYLDQLEVANNPHRFMSDGSPEIYFLDLPAAGYTTGNGMVDQGTGEKAVAIFGLGKGGRSYYALNILNPFQPTLAWALRPDEASSLAQTRLGNSSLNLAHVQTLVQNMGFSTSQPSFGRVVNSSTLAPEDVVFLGGGYSNAATEAKFPNSSGGSTPLGRSVLALDAYTGNIMAAADLSGFTAASGSAPGPISAGLVPFQFIQNSGEVQRAYFMDFNGGLWCWDQDQSNFPSGVSAAPAPYTGFRVDTPYLDHWTGDGSVTGSSKIRQIYQDTDTVNAKYYSDLPSVFRVSYFPGAPNNSNSTTPSAAGITMVSGDRNNPLDNSGGYTNATLPSYFRLTQVFDRQDSALWAGKSGGTAVLQSDGVIRDVNLANLGGTPGNGLPYYTTGGTGSGIVTPGSSTYYLAPVNSDGTSDTGQTLFGYYINFPQKFTNNGSIFVPKGITSPYVVSGSLFYSYFYPLTADPCAGGTGETFTDVVCDVMNPAMSATGASCVTGDALSFYCWTGVASTLEQYGTQGAIQVGVDTTTSNGVTTSTLTSQVLKGNASAQYSKIRVWRVVH